MKEFKYFWIIGIEILRSADEYLMDINKIKKMHYVIRRNNAMQKMSCINPPTNKTMHKMKETSTRKKNEEEISRMKERLKQVLIIVAG
jgi:hypothetical protein